MNKVTLLGFISQEPTVNEYPETNKAKAKFSIAVNDLRNFNQSYFFNCIAWNPLADYIGSNLHKGDFVAIDGRITNRSYINQSGAKSYITEVIVDNIRNLGSRKLANDENTNKTNSSGQLENTDQQQITDVVDLDNLIEETSKNEENHHHESNENDDYDEDIDWD